nr:MAG TPA: hypothetical protein [Caudoviricetes sp.]
MLASAGNSVEQINGRNGQLQNRARDVSLASYP